MRKLILLSILFLCPGWLWAGSTTTVTTQFILGDHDTLSNATVMFELYGVSTVIDTNSDRVILCRPVIAFTDDSGYVSVSLLRNEYLVKQKYGARNPWWEVTVFHSTVPQPFKLYFTIDADSVSSFSFGTNSDAVQFTPPD